MTELNNLDALAGQIYKEGVEKADLEAKEIKQKAESEAQKIIEQAKAEADRIVSTAYKESEKLRSSVNNELEIKSKQALSDLKSDIEKSILKDSLIEPVKGAFKSIDFTVELILNIAKKWSKTDEVEIEISEDQAKLIEQHIQNELNNNLPKLKIKTHASVSAGFLVNVKDKGYLLSFTDDDFIEFLKPYYSEKIKELLFK